MRKLPVTIGIIACCILFLIINFCKKELYEAKEIAGKEKNPVDKLNFNEFLKETNSNDLSTVQRVLSNGTTSGQRNVVSSSSDYNGLVIYTDFIEKITKGEHVSYTFPVKLKTSRATPGL